jgi:hypothetical protein
VQALGGRWWNCCGGCLTPALAIHAHLFHECPRTQLGLKKKKLTDLLTEGDDSVSLMAYLKVGGVRLLSAWGVWGSSERGRSAVTGQWWVGPLSLVHITLAPLCNLVQAVCK